MEKYSLKYDVLNKRLFIALGGNWTLEDTKEYQKALIEYVASLSVKTVLIDQCNAGEFPPEAIEVFKENNKIPQLKDARVACLLAPFVYEVIMEQMKNIPEVEMIGVPKYFNFKEKAEAYLNE